MYRIYCQGLRATIDEFGVTQGIMMFVIAAIMIAVLLPVLAGVMHATPVFTNNLLQVNNMTADGAYIAAGTIPNTTGAGYGTLAASGMQATQTTMYTTIGSSYGLLVVVLILVAAACILGAIGLFKYFGGQD